METIGAYMRDQSDNGRINAWWMAWNLAKENFFASRFMIYEPDMFIRNAPDPLNIDAAHSSYFVVLWEHGFVSLFLFLLMWFLVWRTAGHLRVEGKKLPKTLWLSHLGAMCQVSLAGYAVWGAFLSVSYYQMPYSMLVLMAVGCRWLDGKEWMKEDAQAPAALQRREQLAIGAKPASP